MCMIICETHGSAECVHVCEHLSARDLDVPFFAGAANPVVLLHAGEEIDTVYLCSSCFKAVGFSSRFGDCATARLGTPAGERIFEAACVPVCDNCIQETHNPGV